jgi:hypothetical protein
MVCRSITVRNAILLTFLPLALFTTLGAMAQKKEAYTARWTTTETESEVLWTGRFAHCDYGFYVLLPDGFTAHTQREVFHGLLISLPDTGTTRYLSVFKDERLVSVVAEHNSLEWKSLHEAATHHNESRADKPGFKLVAVKAEKLNGVPAMRTRVEYDGANGRMVAEEVIAMRWGIVYTISLRTTPADYQNDHVEFTRVLAGFRFWKIHYCP